jgi:hypothetical protein
MGGNDSEFFRWLILRLIAAALWGMLTYRPRRAILWFKCMTKGEFFYRRVK